MESPMSALGPLPPVSRWRSGQPRNLAVGQKWSFCEGLESGHRHAMSESNGLDVPPAATLRTCV